MKVLIIAPELYPVPSPAGTSVETCIYNIAKRLAKRHHVTVLSKRADGLPHMTVRGQLRIVRVNSGGKAHYIAAVVRWLSGKSFDVIQIENRPEFLPKVKACAPATPAALFLHSLTYVSPPKTSRAVVRKQLAYADLIVANSRSLKQKLKTYFPKQAKKLHVVHPGVDTARFRPPTAAERHKVRAKYSAADAFAIVYAGRLIPIKGIPVLIRAAAVVRKHVPKAKLYIIGSGKRRYAAYLKKLGRCAAVPVHFIGEVPSRAIHKMYWLADCFVCPSQEHEAFGLVIVEALAAGVPTVASHNGGMKEIIKHGHNGMLVRHYHSPHAFAREIIKLAKDRQLSERLSKAGRKTCAARFQWGHTAKRLERLYQTFKS